MTTINSTKTYSRAISSVDLEPLQSYRLELKLIACAHPVLMRHLKGMPKKTLGPTLLALAELGARTFYFPDIAGIHTQEKLRDEPSNAKHVSTTEVEVAVSGPSTSSHPAIDWIDEALVRSFSEPL